MPYWTLVLDRRIVRILFAGMLAGLLAVPPARPDKPRIWTFQPDFVAPAQLPELSGLAASRRHPGVLWALNDSGNEPRLVAISSEGKLLGGPTVDHADNVDWEDMALDQDILYVSDMGNNFNDRKDLCVYQLPEPDPRGEGPIEPVARFPVIYPEQGRAPEFDCEAMFVWEHRLYFLTKERIELMGRQVPSTGARLYRLDTHFTDRPNRLTLIQRSTGLGGWVTAADVSPDGKTLAVLCHMPVPSVWLFRQPEQGDRWLSHPTGRLILSKAGQCEALTWESDGVLLLGNEEGEVGRISLAEFAGSGR